MSLTQIVYGKQNGAKVFAEYAKTPTYFLIAGAIGAGKTTGISYMLEHAKVLQKNPIVLFDMDVLMMERNIDYNDKQERQKIIDELDLQIKETMNQRKSLVAMGTASNLPFSIDRLHQAKMLGYQTVLFHYNTDLNTAIERNESRRKMGGRYKNITPGLIIDTYHNSRNTVNVLTKTNLVDYSIRYNE